MNLAGPDLIIILLIVLVLFGAKKLPELARGMGQAVKEFQKAKDEFRMQIKRLRPATKPIRRSGGCLLANPVGAISLTANVGSAHEEIRSARLTRGAIWDKIATSLCPNPICAPVSRRCSSKI
ncbi:MAG: hypothetical protein DME77_08160 [Verrucomicrobia bacterium]|nr:MAG: hypothetical protein DME77_08160 [Verrucomicrobiota bacterium]